MHDSICDPDACSLANLRCNQHAKETGMSRTVQPVAEPEGSGPELPASMRSNADAGAALPLPLALAVSRSSVCLQPASSFSG